MAFQLEQMGGWVGTQAVDVEEGVGVSTLTTWWGFIHTCTMANVHV